MKVPEQVKQQAAKKEPQPKKETTAKNINLTKYRKSKKFKQNIAKLILIIICIALFAWVWFNADRLFEPLRGIASKIETRTSTSIGFPVTLPGSAGYSFEKFGENFSLLTDTYLYTYMTTGEQIYALRHGYSNPSQITSDRRILLYDKASYNFALYNKTSLIYEKTVDDKILFGALGSDDMVAIVTASSRYSNILYVYDSGGNWKYTKKFADENIMNVAFTGDGQHLTATTVSVDSGEIVTTVYKYSVRSSESYEWKYSFRSNSLPCGLYADENNVITICDNKVVSLDCGSGELNGEYTFSGELMDFGITQSFMAIYYNDVSTNRNTIITLDHSAQPVATASAGSNAHKILLDNDTLYVLDGMNIRVFRTSLLESGETTTLTEDYTDFIKIADSVYLLGYDTVNTERIG
ncbi:MAG: hypothetical protein IJ416_11250 [Ruminiclostridium sp.]|nr:hypothetical protein [Ruminiclostridium sp.]